MADDEKLLEYLRTATARALEAQEQLANERAKRILGWRQETSLEDGLRDTLNWLRDHAGARLEQAATVFHG